MVGEARLFGDDVQISLAEGEITLFRGEVRVVGAVEVYRRVIRGESAGDAGAEGLVERLRQAGFLRAAGASAAAAAESGGGPGQGLPAELGALRPYVVLGRGSFGSVYAAFDAARGIDCAVKICDQADNASILDLKNEVRTAWSLSHPNVVVPYELRCEHGRWFFAMELVRGRRIVDAFAAVPASARLGWLTQVFGQIADALDFVHAHGVLHLDLTPNNILVREDGTPAILDLGLARWGGARPIGTLGVEPGATGTLSYIAPEVLLGRAPTAASDWYSLGIVLFKVLSGRMPFAEMGAMEITLRPLASPPTSLRRIEWIPRALAAACEGMLERRPERRAGSAALRAALGVGREASVELVVGASDTGAFLGREGLLEALAAHQRSVAASGPVLVRVGGPPGIGKSALIRRFAAGSGALVLAGRCYENEHLPYKGIDGVIDALRGWLARGADPALLARVRPLLGGLARIFPGLRDLVDATGVEAVAGDPRMAAYQALKGVLLAISAETPLLLILDDVHWADRDSARLLAELLSPPAAAPMMVVCAHRLGEAGAFLGELAEMEALGALYRSAELTVGPLDEASLVALATRFGARVDTGAVARAVADSAGSPFLVEELARYLGSHGGAAPAVIALRDAVAARLGALLPVERELVELTAVAGRSLDERLVAAVAVAEGPAVSRGLVTLRSRRLLHGTSAEGRPTVAIYHDRLRTEVVALMDPSRRDALHRRWIAALEPEGAPPHELFIHYQALGEGRRAASLALAAAVQAEEALAFARAAEWYREALAGDHEGARAELLRRQAEALFNSGRTAAAGDVFVAAAEAAPGGGRVFQRRAADAYLLAGRLADGRRLLAPLLRAHEVPVAPGTVRLVGSLLRQIVSLRVRGIAGEVSESRASEDDLEMIDACWSLGKALAFVEPLAGVDFVLRCLHRSLSVGDPQRVARSLAFLAAGVFFQVPILRGRARGYLDEARALAERLEDPSLLGVMRMWEGMIEIGAGNWRLALEEVEGALVALDQRWGVDWERVIAGGLVVWLRMHLGDVRGALDLAGRMYRDASERGDLYGQVNFIQYLAWQEMLRGRPEEARRLVQWISAAWSPGRYTVQSFYVMMIEVLCALYEGDAQAAAARWQQGQAGFRRAGGERAPQSRIDNMILEARVLLRGPRSASGLRRLAALQRALAGEERSDARAHAGWLVAATRCFGEPKVASAGFTAAAADYAALGLEHWANSALLQAHRLDPRRPPAPGVREYFAAHSVEDTARWVETFMPCGAPLPSSIGS